MATPLECATGTGRAEPEHAETPKARVWPAAAVLVAFSLVFVARTVVRYRGRPYFALFDDAMISLRFAHNLAFGHGLVWNPGQPPVEGYTNFGWTVWMALLHLLGLPGPAVVLAVIASAVALSTATLWLVRAIAFELWPGDAERAAVAVWLTALSYPLAFWALRGMEVAALSWCTCAATLEVLRSRRGSANRRSIGRLAAVVAVALLLRTDAVVVCCLAVAVAAWWAPDTEARRRVLLLGGGAVVVTLGIHTAFRLAYYGDPLPNTYYLKIGGTDFGTRLGRGAASTAALATSSLMGLLAFGGVAVVTEGARRTLWLLVAMVGGAAAYSVYVGGDAWEWMLIANRYQAVCLPLLCVLAAGGLVTVLEGCSTRRRGVLSIVALLALLSVLLADHNLPPTGALQYVLHNTQDLADRTAATFAAAALLLTLALLRRLPRGGALAGMVAMCLLLDAGPLANWIRTGGPHVDDDATMALYGLVIRDATAPGAKVAVMWAGGSPYYSGRPSIDLLGKSDRHIAKEAPQRVPFYPGHTKWDYAWSIGRLRPDLVADIFRDTADVDDQLRTWGYDNVAPKVWVRHDSTAVDRKALLNGLGRYPRIEELVSRHL